jgi:propanol-preferring alcohol dehydrogenase
MVVEGQLDMGSGEPTTIGHEAVGQIVSLGSTASSCGFKEGDYIGFINAYHACFNCEGCKNHYIYCTSSTMVMQGFSCNGYFQEYCVVDSGVSVILPKDMDASVSAPIFCAGITAYQAVLTTKLKAGEWLAVIGCGGLGQLAIRYATAMGYKVIAIDISDSTLRTAHDSGTLHTFKSRTDPDFITQIHTLTSGGCHACTVFAAVKAGYNTSTKILRVGGNLVPVGIAKEDITISTFDLTMKKFYINAANNAAQPSELKACAEFTAAHGISSPSRYYRLEQIGEMIELMQKEKMDGYRLVVRFDQENGEVTA